MNQVAPFVRVIRPFELQKLASDWGLFYTSHHYDILLSNPFGYDRFGLAKERGVTGEYNWSSNQEGILKYWEAGLEENKELDVIWPVGLRGTADTAYQFPEGTTQAEKNKVFTDAIQDQVDLAKSIAPGDKEPVFHFTLYGEMLRNYQSGSFDFPEEVILVWNDTGDAVMRALPENLGKWKHGIYYHLAYYGGTTKQTHHTVQPERIEKQFRDIVASGATEYLLFNVSEVREFVMNTRFIADISWDAETAFAKPEAAKRFSQWWSKEYFGEPAAMATNQTYESYFDIIHSHDQLMEGAKNLDRALNKLQFRLAGDHHIHYTEEDTDNLAVLSARLESYDTAFESYQQANGNMNDQQQRFFFENVKLGLLMDYRPTKAASYLNEALRKYPDEEALRYVSMALDELEILESELRKAERPPFENWYRDTWIRRSDSRTNPHYSYYRVKEYLENYEPRYK
ncbi:MAG: glycosyl hydrolase 115 family protein [Pseudohongiellaceae bacterium]